MTVTEGAPSEGAARRAVSEMELLKSWEDNAAAWTRLVRQGLLRSRVDVTNSAILEAVGDARDGPLLDLGCGEGWLAHRMAELGWPVLGVDAVPALIELARTGPGEFLVASYQDLATALAGRTFAGAVANFSLLGEQSVEQALAATASRMIPGARLLIQTLHPLSVRPYRDGWRSEEWDGMDSRCSPAPWYFRTLESWSQLLSRHGFSGPEFREPRSCNADEPSSLVIIAQKV